MAVGTVTVTRAAVGRGIQRITLDWTADGSGDVSANPFDVMQGWLRQHEHIAVGSPLPTTAWDEVLNDEQGADVFEGGGANISQSVAPITRLDPPMFLDGSEQLDLVVSNAGAGGIGRTIIWIGP